MRVVSVLLRNFRCFSELHLDFNNPVILIQGPNGSGKTSILEALHYACYFKSFKTHLPKEIIRLETDGFSAQLGVVSQTGFDSLTVQCARSKKTVKLNDAPLKSFKELYSLYKVVSLGEDDLAIIQGSPSIRRSFLDHMILLHTPSYAQQMRQYKIILENRSALLAAARFDADSYAIWTDKLLSTSQAIVQARLSLIAQLNEQVKELTDQLTSFDEITLAYQPARPYQELPISSTELAQVYPGLEGHERTQRRTLIGAHLDDCTFSFNEKVARSFASRGQQKWILFLLKLAYMKTLPSPGILLLDDFMTDFDIPRVKLLIPLIMSTVSQLIITSPTAQPLEEILAPYSPQIISLESILDPTTRKIQEKNREV